MYRNLTSLLILLSVLLPSSAQELDGFAEPYREIELAAAEMGTIAEIAVKEGDRVKSGQVLASLNDDVLVASLKVAEEAMEAEGKLKSATAELKLQQTRYEKLLGLRARRHASQTEVDRAATQLEIAKSQLQSVKEDIRIKKMEFRRIEAQLEQRRIKSPIQGIVTRVTKDQGEFVSPNDPVVATVVQLDPLLVVFSVPKEVARKLRQNEKVPVNFEDVETSGTVEFVSPTTDAQSGTTRVKVRVPNPKLELQSGDLCTLMLEGEGPSVAVSPPTQTKTVRLVTP